MKHVYGLLAALVGVLLLIAGGCHTELFSGAYPANVPTPPR